MAPMILRDLLGSSVASTNVLTLYMQPHMTASAHCIWVRQKLAHVHTMAATPSCCWKPPSSILQEPLSANNSFRRKSCRLQPHHTCRAQWR